MKYPIFSLLTVAMLALSMPAQADLLPKFLQKKKATTKVTRILRRQTLTHPNGKVKESFSQYTNLNGQDIRHGAFTVYNLNGTMKSNGVYADGLIIRRTDISWYGSGAKSQETSFQFDKKGRKTGKGLVTAWYLNGKQKRSWTYHDGVLVKKVSYYESGVKEYVQSFDEEGRAHGSHRAWYANAKQTHEFNFKNGKKDGSFLEWSTTGVLTRNEKYKDDVLIERDGNEIVQPEGLFNYSVDKRKQQADRRR